MKTIALIAFILTFGVAEIALGQEGDQQKPKLSTDLRFSAMEVTGKYQYADEALALVEDEKGLDDLLGIRSDFKDRLKRETKRK